jgi:iron complex outermembrane receptor protein
VSTLVGSQSFTSESVKDFEAGYRAQISKVVSADVALYFDRFSDLRTFIGGNPVLAFSPAPYLLETATVANGATGTGKGGEASVAWQLFSDWKLEGSYSYSLINSWISPSAPAGSVVGDPKQPPRSMWRLQSYVNLSKSWKLDNFVYWTGKGSPETTYGPPIPIPAYTRFDIRLGYKVNRHWQISVAGQNLLQARHLEGVPELLSAYSYVNRAGYLKSTWQF